MVHYGRIKLFNSPAADMEQIIIIIGPLSATVKLATFRLLLREAICEILHSATEIRSKIKTIRMNP